jgi:hypothetical protein
MPGAWTRRLATGDRRLQREIGVLAFTRQADRGDPGQERRARVARHPQRQRRVGLELHAALLRARQGEPEVDVHIDQPRQQVRPGQVDHVGIGRLSGELTDRADPGDAVASTNTPVLGTTLPETTSTTEQFASTVEEAINVPSGRARARSRPGARAGGQPG